MSYITAEICPICKGFISEGTGDCVDCGQCKCKKHNEIINYHTNWRCISCQIEQAIDDNISLKNNVQRLEKNIIELQKQVQILKNK
jgi:hypothetical protein